RVARRRAARAGGPGRATAGEGPSTTAANAAGGGQGADALREEDDRTAGQARGAQVTSSGSALAAYRRRGRGCASSPSGNRLGRTFQSRARRGELATAAVASGRP